jgi:hypothetical protein
MSFYTDMSPDRLLCGFKSCRVDLEVDIIYSKRKVKATVRNLGVSKQSMEFTERPSCMDSGPLVGVTSITSVRSLCSRERQTVIGFHHQSTGHCSSVWLQCTILWSCDRRLPHMVTCIFGFFPRSRILLKHKDLGDWWLDLGWWEWVLQQGNSSVSLWTWELSRAASTVAPVIRKPERWPCV